MLFDKLYFVPRIISGTNAVKVGTTTKLTFSVVEVFTKTQAYTVSIAIFGGTNREQTILLDYTQCTGESPVFYYSSNFSFIPTETIKGTIVFKATDAQGNNYILDDKIPIEFIS